MMFFVAALVLTAGAATKIKIACVGNSITRGFGANANQAYPYRLQQLFGTAKYTVENDGVDATTMTNKDNSSYWKTSAFSQVFAFQPNIITIKLGTNDTKPQYWDSFGRGVQYKADYLAMIDTFSHMASKPKIWLVLPVPVFNNPTATSWGIRDSVIKKIIPIIKEIGTERNLPVIDANTPLLSFPQYFSVDGVHPNAAGLDTIAHVIYRALLAATATFPEHAAFKGVSPRHRETWAGIGFPSTIALSPSTRLFDLSGRRHCADRRLERAGLPVYKWYILNH
jgi:lysophospholipase L1-like esterase